MQIVATAPSSDKVSVAIVETDTSLSSSLPSSVLLGQPPQQQQQQQLPRTLPRKSLHPQMRRKRFAPRHDKAVAVPSHLLHLNGFCGICNNSNSKCLALSTSTMASGPDSSTMPDSVRASESNIITVPASFSVPSSPENASPIPASSPLAALAIVDCSSSCSSSSSSSDNLLKQQTSESSPFSARETPHIKAKLSLLGMCCSSEVPTVRKLLRTIPSVQTIQINIVAKQVTVRFTNPADATALKDVLTTSGFPATIIETISILPCSSKISIEPQHSHEKSDFVESTILVEDTDVVNRLQISPAQLPTSPDSIRAWFVSPASRTLKIEHHKDFTISNIMIYLCIHLACPRDSMSVLTDGIAEELYLPCLTSPGLVSEVNGGTCVKKDCSSILDIVLLKKRQFPFTSTSIPLPVVVSGIFWFLSMMSSFAQIKSFEAAGLVSIFFGLPPVARKAWNVVFYQWRIDASVMMLVAALGAMILNEWEEAASVAFLFSLSEHLERHATRRAITALSHLQTLQPMYGRVVTNVPQVDSDETATASPTIKTVVTLVPAASIGIDSILQVRTGDAFVVDGIVVEGTSKVDESSLTGESRPIQKAPGDHVMSGSLNVGIAPLLIKTTRISEESAVGRLVNLVEQAQASNQGRTLALVDGFARTYTPVVLVVATLLATLSWCGGVQAGRYWTYNALILIVIACPCALTIAAPVTYAAALATTANRGIIVKGGGSVLEQIGAVGKIFFDKTGTLTLGKFEVVHLIVTNEATNRLESLKIVAALEASSSHPLAGSLLEAAKREGACMTRDVVVSEHSLVDGEGVQALLNGLLSYVGNQRMMCRLGFWESFDSSYKHTADEWRRTLGGCTIGFVAIQGRGIVCMYCLTDRLRPGAYQVVQSLLSEGFEVALLTGDDSVAAHAVAKQVGLPSSAVHSELLPEDKLHLVGSSLVRNHRRACGAQQVLFVGDGINDGPALATADIGVSMGEGAAALVTEMSDVTLLDSSLSKLKEVLSIGRLVRRTIRENIALSLICKVVVVGLTSFGYMTLMFAIISDVGVMLLVTLNGMKLLTSVSSDIPSINGALSSASLHCLRLRKPQSSRRIGRKQYIGLSASIDSTSSQENFIDVML